jgi:hypothetical protein
MKMKRVINIERLRGTLEAVKADLEHFNPRLWVTPPNSKMYPETCGDFGWFAIQKYGNEDQKKAVGFDKCHDRETAEILGLTKAQTKALLWGGNDLDMIEKLITKWSTK